MDMILRRRNPGPSLSSTHHFTEKTSESHVIEKMKSRRVIYTFFMYCILRGLTCIILFPLQIWAHFTKQKIQAMSKIKQGLDSHYNHISTAIVSFLQK
jgi:hypothetical protein